MREGGQKIVEKLEVILGGGQGRDSLEWVVYRLTLTYILGFNVL